MNTRIVRPEGTLAALRLRALSVALALIASAAQLPAQYRVFDWIHANEGRLPASVSLGHKATPDVVRPLALAGPDAPDHILDGWASAECGTHAVAFTPGKERPHLSLLSHLALDRNLLGSNGRALYQADFFLPPKGAKSPSVSLLAAEDKLRNRQSKHWYRFGLNTNGNAVFFSYTPGTEAPTVYHQMAVDKLELARPAWHRFQIIFEGNERIVCAIDGKPVKFPAINEPTLRLLNAGVFVASVTGEEARFTVPAIVDNLSVQYSPALAPIPDSPWARDPAAATSAPRGDVSPLDPASGLPWLDNPQEAWAMARATRRPLMVLWHVPRSAPSRYLEELMPRDAATREALARHILLRVDVNQLAGGSQAQKFNIVRLPTLIVLTPDGIESNRLPVIQGQTTADTVASFLKG